MPSIHLIDGFFYKEKGQLNLAGPFLYKIVISFYANKSKTNEGNNPMIIFNTIATTATA